MNDNKLHQPEKPALETIFQTGKIAVKIITKTISQCQILRLPIFFSQMIQKMTALAAITLQDCIDKFHTETIQ